MESLIIHHRASAVAIAYEAARRFGWPRKVALEVAQTCGELMVLPGYVLKVGPPDPIPPRRGRKLTQHQLPEPWATWQREALERMRQRMEARGVDPAVLAKRGLKPTKDWRKHKPLERWDVPEDRKRKRKQWASRPADWLPYRERMKRERAARKARES